MQKTCCWISANITSQWSPHVTNCGCHHVINAPLELQPSASIRDHVLFATCRRHSLRHIPFVFDPFEIQRVFFQSFTGTAPWLLRLGHSAWMHLQWWCICLPDSNEKLHHKHPKAPKSTRKLENDVCSNAHGNTHCNLRKISCLYHRWLHQTALLGCLPQRLWCDQIWRREQPANWSQTRTQAISSRFCSLKSWSWSKPIHSLVLSHQDYQTISNLYPASHPASHPSASDVVWASVMEGHHSVLPWHTLVWLLCHHGLLPVQKSDT